MSAEPLPVARRAVLDTSLGRIEHGAEVSMARVLDILRTLTNGVALWRQLKLAQLDKGLVWIVPRGWPDITCLYGIPVRHADVPAPLLAHDVPPFP